MLKIFFTPKTTVFPKKIPNKFSYIVDGDEKVKIYMPLAFEHVKNCNDTSRVEKKKCRDSPRQL